jgi:hypothetical protein
MKGKLTGQRTLDAADLTLLWKKSFPSYLLKLTSSWIFLQPNLHKSSMYKIVPAGLLHRHNINLALTDAAMKLAELSQLTELEVVLQGKRKTYLFLKYNHRPLVPLCCATLLDRIAKFTSFHASEPHRIPYMYLPLPEVRISDAQFHGSAEVPTLLQATT